MYAYVRKEVKMQARMVVCAGDTAGCAYDE